jgi:hypothetical protein
MSSRKYELSPTYTQLKYEKNTLAIDGCIIKNTTNVEAIILVFNSWNCLLNAAMTVHKTVELKRIISGDAAKNINLRVCTCEVSSMSSVPLCKKQSNENISWLMPEK